MARGQNWHLHWPLLRQPNTRGLNGSRRCRHATAGMPVDDLRHHAVHEPPLEVAYVDDGVWAAWNSYPGVADAFSVAPQ